MKQIGLPYCQDLPIHQFPYLLECLESPILHHLLLVSWSILQEHPHQHQCLLVAVVSVSLSTNHLDPIITFPTIAISSVE